MNWESILKVSPKVWQRFVVKLFQESPNRSMTVSQVLSNLIDNSTVGGSVYQSKTGGNVKQETMKYSNVPTIHKLRVFLGVDDRFRKIPKRTADEFIWAGGEEE